MLLHSSRQSRTLLTPVRISLETAVNPPSQEQYNKSMLPVAVLLEGSFKSHFQNRLFGDFLRVYKDTLGYTFKEVGEPTRMIVISDGDIIANEVRGEESYPLGYYRFNPGYPYANEDFLLNCLDYLVDNYGLVQTRSKEFKIRPLDVERISTSRTKWQLINVAFPVIIILLFAGAYNFIRLRKYTQ
jgi:gliding-associated putative ABC transporter substrate-binding component GldG